MKCALFVNVEVCRYIYFFFADPVSIYPCFSSAYSQLYMKLRIRTHDDIVEFSLYDGRGHSRVGQGSPSTLWLLLSDVEIL